MLLSWKKKRDKIRRKLLFKKLFVFDLDGTLAPSKGSLSKEMESMLCHVLRSISDVKIGIISGCKYEQMYYQFAKPIIDKLLMSDPHGSYLRKLFLLPTSGSAFYRWNRSEKRFGRVYKESLSLVEKTKIVKAFENAKGYHYALPNPHGEIAEDRDTQITFSLCGQEAPLNIKEEFDPDCITREHICKIMAQDLPGFRVAFGGTTSIDVSKEGLDKASGVNRLLKYSHTFKKNTMFIGDSLQDGGNDASVKSLNIDCVSVDDPSDTFEMLVFLVKELLADDKRRQKDMIVKQYNAVIRGK